MQLSQVCLAAFIVSGISVVPPLLPEIPVAWRSPAVAQTLQAQTDNPFWFLNTDPQSSPSSADAPLFVPSTQFSQPASPDSSPRSQDRLLEIDRLNQQGIRQAETSRYQEAIQLWQRVLELSQGDELRRIAPAEAQEWKAWAMNNLGTAYYAISQYEQAIATQEQALSIFRSLSNRKGEASALNNLGNVYLALSQYERSIEMYQQAVPVLRELGDRVAEGEVLGNLGTAYSYLKQPQRAIGYYEQALSIHRELSNRVGEANALTNTGATYIDLRQFQRAIDYCEQALPIYRSLGNRNGEALALNILGVAYGNLRQYEQSIRYYQESLPLYRAVDDRSGEARLLATIGRMYVAQNSPISAIEQLQKAIDVYESIRAGIRGLPLADQQAYTNSIADDYRLLANLLQRQNRNREAQAILDLL